jgi:ubiquinone/menaquinone biosynthesis C-methylase UbiE
VRKRKNSVDLTVFPPSIYNFLRYTEKYSVEKIVLDCGAGGRRPPLALFANHGYEACGIDNADSQIERANCFASEYNVKMNIRKADIRKIPFDNETFGCVYSWNSSIHLTKNDTEVALSEMLRVLKKRGLLYVNFIWDRDLTIDLGEERNMGEFWSTIDGEECVHSCFSETETNQFFTDVQLLYKQKRQITVMRDNKILNDAYLDYIVRK